MGKEISCRELRAYKQEHLKREAKKDFRVIQKSVKICLIIHFKIGFGVVDDSGKNVKIFIFFKSSG
jgi:hypothetical protein